MNIAVSELSKISSAAEFTLLEMIGVTNGAVDRKRTAYALRLAKLESEELHAKILAAALAGRADWRKRQSYLQRDWQTKASRRSQRNRHHDSAAIRERYVRCAG